MQSDIDNTKKKETSSYQTTRTEVDKTITKANKLDMNKEIKVDGKPFQDANDKIKKPKRMLTNQI